LKRRRPTRLRGRSRATSRVDDDGGGDVRSGQ
jgi:hypothetical protein